VHETHLTLRTQAIVFADGACQDAMQSSDDDSSDGMKPELSTTDAKGALLSTKTTTQNRPRNTGALRLKAIVYIDKSGSQCDVFYDAGTNPASTEILALCSKTPPPPGKQSYPTANLNSPILRSGQQIGRGTNMKKVSRPPS